MSNPSHHYTHTYTRLATPDTIRLFDLNPGSPTDTAIHGTLRDIRLPDNDHYAATPEYTALSYTWGLPTSTTIEPPLHISISINGHALAVRPNLFAALHALRDPDDVTTLWIDAVCINQADVYERNNQVALMAKIYRLAEQVEIWLGALDEFVTVAFDWIRHVSSHMGDTPPPPPLDALNALLGRPYWSRVWIVQEVQLAQHIILRSGDQRILWIDFAYACSVLLRTFQSRSQSRPRSLATNSNAFGLVDQRVKTASALGSILTHRLETLIRTYKDCECADPRDHIFGFLSLAADCAFGTGLKADYAITRLELFARTMEFCQPRDPRSFGSVLLRALARGEGDGQWMEAVRVWDTVVLERLDRGVNSTGGVVQVIQFVVAVSSRADWVRCYSYFAYGQYQERGGELRDGGSVRRLDRWNLCLRMDDSQYVIVSTDQMKAVSNPCASLELHDRTGGCVRGQCSSLWKA